MSLASVRAYFATLGMEDRVVTLPASTATVAEAAAAHGVEPGQICKTLAFKVGDEPLLILVAGDQKIDNAKYKAQFGAKAKMLTPEETLEYTSHPIGGVCPFGLPRPLPAYLDLSLRAYPEVIPAAGDRHSAIRLTVEELEAHSQGTWIDVCK